MTTDQKIIANKVVLLKLAATLGSVSQACKVMGYSRDSFYGFKEVHRGPFSHCWSAAAPLNRKINNQRAESSARSRGMTVTVRR